MMSDDSGHNDDHARSLLAQAGENASLATEKYYDWVKQMLSLSFAALTALVALQGNYKPNSDLPRYLLWATFSALAASVIASAIILRGDGQATRDLSRQMAEDSQRPSHTRSGMHLGSPPRYAKFAQKCLPWILALSVLCLSVFAITNSL